MAITSAALGCVAPTSLAIANSQVSSLHNNMEAVSASSSVFRPRAAIESSSFLGERVACSPPSSVSNCSGLNVRALIAMRGGARCIMGPESQMRNTSGRIIFTPFGPLFTPGRGRNGRREWEKRNRFQEERIRAQKEMMRAKQARFRKMIEGQLRNSTQNRDMALLWELERRLRAEAGRQEGATEQSDIDELMKNLEKRLRPEKQSNENESTETEKTRDRQQSEYSTIYDYLNAWLKQWDQGMKEERERLQKQWEEANTAQQPERSSEPDVKTEDSSSTLKDRQDQVYSPEELLKAEEEENQKKFEEEERKKAVAEQQEKTEDSSSTLKERQDHQVFSPEELQKAEEEENQKKLEEDEQKKAAAEQQETTEDSLSTLKERQDHQVYSPEELQKAEEEIPKLLEEEEQKIAAAEQAGKTEDSLSTLKERQDQVYSPEELQKAEEEERRALLEEEEKKEAAAEQAESKKVDETANSKHDPSDGTVVYLKNKANGAELYLVGTVHVSQQSADEVRDVIKKVQPNYVMVELDRKRYNSMVQRQSGRYNPFAFMQQMVETFANGNIGNLGKVMGLGLSGFYQLLAARGLQPGQELKVAMEEGKKIGAKVVLGDQDIDITLKHFGEQMSMADALGYFAQPMPSDIVQKMSGASRAPGSSPAQMFDQLRDRKLARRLNEDMESRAPAFNRVLVRERNEVMTKALRNLSGKVVAVVGLAHLDGIEQLWREANEKYLNGTE